MYKPDVSPRRPVGARRLDGADVVIVGAPFEGGQGRPLRADRASWLLAEPPGAEWMDAQGMRWFEMTDIVRRGLDTCLDEAFTIAVDDCDGVLVSIDVDVVDPGMAPGTGTPEPGGLTARQLLDAVRRCGIELPVSGSTSWSSRPPTTGRAR